MRIQLKQELCERSNREEALQQSEKIFRRMFDQSPIGTAIVTLDYRFKRANPAFCLMVGYSEEELQQHTFVDITDPYILEEELVLVKKLEAEEIDQFQMDKRYIHRSGKIIWVNLSVRIMRNSAGHALYFLPMMVEITDRKQAEASLAAESSINAALVDLSRALMSKTSLTDIPGLVLEHAMYLTGSEIGFVGYIDKQTGYLISTNRSLAGIDQIRCKEHTQMFQEFTGLSGWVLKNKQSIIANHPKDDPRASGLPASHIPIHRFLSAPAIVNDRLVGQIALANSPKDYEAADLTIVERLSTLYGAAVYQQQLREKLFFLSVHDPLTGLYNRRYFEEEFQRLKESNHFPICIVFCDVDQLKIVNDRYGHLDGDEVIRRAGKILQSTFRSEDLVARIGGDEFVVLLLHAHTNAADEAMRRIKENIELDNQQNDSPPVMMSLGTATAENQAQLDEAVIRADAAMYLEKQNRRQRKA
jgi:diguanylate cyclase (GGDEF)-like protein/PAS domain S-box-containing protein